MQESGRHLRPLVVLLVVVIVIAALRSSQFVSMPVGVALFTVVLAWPLQRRLERRLPRGLSLGITLLILLLSVALLGGALYLCADSVASKAPAYGEQLSVYWDKAAAWARQKHLPIQPDQIHPEQMITHAIDAASGLARGVYELVGLFALVAAFVVLALLEVPSFHHTLVERIGTPTALKLLTAAEEIAKSIQRFMLTRTLTSAVVGVLTSLYAWALGLELAFVWGVIAFLLNYVPVIGAVIAVIPPTLVAMLQPEAIWLAPFTLGGLSVIHFTIGNYVDPVLQGKFLSFSPLILFYSIAFWGWVWGIPGALLAVPLTVSIAIICRHFEETEWIAELLSNQPAPPEHVPAQENEVPASSDLVDR